MKLSSNARILALWALVVLIGSAITVSYYYGFIILERHDIPIQVNVTPGNRAGFDLTTEMLQFGSLSPGLVEVRHFTVANTLHEQVIVELGVTGEVSEYVSLSTVRAVLDPAQEITIDVQLVAPNIFGVLNGKLTVTIKRA